MATNKFNNNILLTGLNQIQAQNPELAIEETKGIFLAPLESDEELDLEILGINLTMDQPKGVAY